MSQTSCHEDPSAVNASMVTVVDMSANSHHNGDEENHIDLAEASPASTLCHNKDSRSSELTCVPELGRHEKQTNIELQKLALQKLNEEHLDTLWLKLERIMGKKIEDTKQVLEVYGISEGEEDSETEEGQIWRMVQGDAPYTLNLV